MLLKEMKENLNKWKYPMFMGWKTDIQIQCNSYQKSNGIFWSFFSGMEKPILKFIWNFKRPSKAKTILKEKNKLEGLTVPNFKNFLQSYICQNSVVLAYR